MGNKLYVGNLPYSVRDEDLQQSFGQFGAVTSAKVMMERDTGRSKGFGFVEMGSDAEAQAAITCMNGQPLGGRSVVVNEARPMEARPPRTGGGFGGTRQSGRGRLYVCDGSDCSSGHALWLSPCDCGGQWFHGAQDRLYRRHSRRASAGSGLCQCLGSARRRVRPLGNRGAPRLTKPLGSHHRANARKSRAFSWSNPAPPTTSLEQNPGPCLRGGPVPNRSPLTKTGPTAGLWTSRPVGRW